MCRTYRMTWSELDFSHLRYQANAFCLILKLEAWRGEGWMPLPICLLTHLSQKKKTMAKSLRNVCWGTVEWTSLRICLKTWVFWSSAIPLLSFSICRRPRSKCYVYLWALCLFSTAWNLLLCDEWKHLDWCAVRVPEAAPPPVFATVSWQQYGWTGQYYQWPVQQQRLQLWKSPSPRTETFQRWYVVMNHFPTNNSFFYADWIITHFDFILLYLFQMDTSILRLSSTDSCVQSPRKSDSCTPFSSITTDFWSRSLSLERYFKKQSKKHTSFCVNSDQTICKSNPIAIVFP